MREYYWFFLSLYFWSLRRAKKEELEIQGLDKVITIVISTYFIDEDISSSRIFFFFAFRKKMSH